MAPVDSTAWARARGTVHIHATTRDYPEQSGRTSYIQHSSVKKRLLMTGWFSGRKPELIDRSGHKFWAPCGLVDTA
jgi:hypothetical protein